MCPGEVDNEVIEPSRGIKARNIGPLRTLGVAAFVVSLEASSGQSQSRDGRRTARRGAQGVLAIWKRRQENFACVRIPSLTEAVTKRPLRGTTDSPIPLCGQLPCLRGLSQAVE